jgi:hypothetical protein
VQATAINCAKHPWQPAIGACARCGDFICLRCGAQQDSAFFCHACGERVPAAAESVPHDADGPWLRSMRATSLLVWREPYRLFARLADGPINPAWNFATWWCVAMSLVRSLLEQDDVGKTVALAIVAGLSAGVHLLVLGTLFYLLARGLGGTISWSLAARAEGYATAWIGPGSLLQLLVGFFAPNLVVWWIGAGAGAVLTFGGTACAFFGLGRSGGQLTPGRAALASTLVVLPQFLLHLALLLALSQRAAR